MAGLSSPSSGIIRLGIQLPSAKGASMEKALSRSDGAQFYSKAPSTPSRNAPSYIR